MTVHINCFLILCIYTRLFINYVTCQHIINFTLISAWQCVNHSSATAPQGSCLIAIGFLPCLLLACAWWSLALGPWGQDIVEEVEMICFVASFSTGAAVKVTKHGEVQGQVTSSPAPEEPQQHCQHQPTSDWPRNVAAPHSCRFSHCPKEWWPGAVQLRLKGDT